MANIIRSETKFMTNGNARSDCRYYAITIKHMNKNCIDYKEDLDAFLNKHIIEANPNIVIKSQTYEQDSQHRLHMHILAESLCPIKVRSIRYWAVDVQSTGTPEIWDRYIHKHASNQDEQDQILLSHWAYHNNIFDQELELPISDRRREWLISNLRRGDLPTNSACSKNCTYCKPNSKEFDYFKI